MILQSSCFSCFLFIFLDPFMLIYFLSIHQLVSEYCFIQSVITLHVVNNIIQSQSWTTLSKAVKNVVLITFERPVHSTSALARYQNDGVTLFPITLVFFKSCASWKLSISFTMLLLCRADSYKQCCLFSDPVICLYIIVLLNMLCIFKINSV